MKEPRDRDSSKTQQEELNSSRPLREGSNVQRQVQSEAEPRQPDVKDHFDPGDGEDADD